MSEVTESPGDRREYGRGDLRAAVVCRRVGVSGSDNEAHGETTDVSGGGFGAMLDGSYSAGDVVEADLVLDSQMVTVRALVVATSPEGDHQRVHCAFSAPPAAVRSVIEAFVAARRP